MQNLLNLPYLIFFGGEPLPPPLNADVIYGWSLIIYLDSVYTERYMGQPGVEGNYKGYEESDVTRQARHFHPTGDTLRRQESETEGYFWQMVGSHLHR